MVLVSSGPSPVVRGHALPLCFGPRLFAFLIEPLEERYSAQWYRRWGAVFDRTPHILVLGDDGRHTTSGRIDRGEFLDTIETHKWKAHQLIGFAHSIEHVRDGDWVLLHDGWNPQVASLAYIRDTAGPKFKIAGMLHAGTWDPHDYLSQKGLGRWAAACEEGWLEALDMIFVATNFHRELILKHRKCDPAKIKVTGFPFCEADIPASIRDERKFWNKREKIVVFPHRLAAEKQPLQFAQLEIMYRAKYDDDSQWMMTKHFCETKDEYYRLLGRSRVAVSTALQETWGIAMMEAEVMGAVPVAPRRLSYPETMPSDSLYDTLEEAVEIIHRGLYEGPSSEQYRRWPSNEWVASGGPWNSIRRICAEMGVHL